MAYALITGASGGLGLALAREFAKHRHDLVLVARRQDVLEQVAHELRASGVAVEILVADLSVPGVGAIIVDALHARNLEIEWLVNNAGVGSNGTFWELDPQKELDQVTINVTALVDLTRRLLPGMVARKRGRVLNIGSSAGYQAGPFMATYYASKAFVLSFTEAIASELRGTGVTATVSCPGPIATGFGATAGNGTSRLFTQGGVAAADDVAREAYAAMIAGRVSIIHTAKLRIGLTLAKIMPRSVATGIARKLNLP
jgi:hypothetical protein